jgi:hypothetical protein
VHEHDDRAGAQRVDVGGEVLGPAGRCAHVARQRDRARRREVAMEVVDGEQPDVHRARLVALVVASVVVARMGLGGRGADEQRAARTRRRVRDLRTPS